MARINKKRYREPQQQEEEEEEQKLVSTSSVSSFLDSEHKFITKARSLWLFATSQRDLDRSEALYRTFLTRIHKARRGDHGDQVLQLLASMQEGDKEMCQLEDDVNEARKRIFLLMCQSGRDDEAIPRLERLGYIARLSRGILSYEEKALLPQVPTTVAAGPTISSDKGSNAAGIPSIFLSTPALKKKVLGKQAVVTPTGAGGLSSDKGLDTKNNKSSSKFSSSGKPVVAPCWITDHTLSSQSLSTLQSVFNPPDAAYWTTHNYCVEPPSPYFSYVFPLDKSQEYGALGELARAVRSLAVENYEKSAQTRSSGINVKKSSSSSIFERCRYAEVWAHNRPHASGHQLHFDSDDEGRGGIRNPVVGSIFYLSEGVGGPSLVTDQPFGAERLASKGWLCFPKVNRLLVFDGTVLHGVIPGKGFRSADQVTGDYQRRVTLMVALWENIRTRDEETWGSARPYPVPAPYYPSASSSQPTGVTSGRKEAHSANTTAASTNREDLRHKAWVEQLLSESQPPEADSSSGRSKPGQNKGKEGGATDELELSLPQRMAPVELDHVWETLEGKAWNSSKDGIPAYNLVFQGF